MTFVVIDMDNLVFLGKTDKYRNVRIIEEVVCKERKEPLIVPSLESKAAWSALTEMEAMLIGNKYQIDVVLGDYPGNLDKLRSFAASLPELEFSQDQLDLFNADYRALEAKYESSPIIHKSVDDSKSNPPAEIKPPSPKGSTGRVWEIADSILNGSSYDLKTLRKVVIETCEVAGIHSATAATQWSKWKKARGL